MGKVDLVKLKNRIRTGMFGAKRQQLLRVSRKWPREIYKPTCACAFVDMALKKAPQQICQ
ncbi:MAG: hypothetical protein CM1200mP30_15340 [Pseudomonadota bacterium]|nr:MAG: hypothetical protein CM1200mP30_15340 [Pseudomonadota bacterium]